MEDWLELSTVGDVLRKGAARYPDRDAIVFPDGRLTYAQLEQRAIAVGRSLTGMGVRKGDHVGVLMPNCLDFVELIFGMAYVGAVGVLVNARFKARELAYVIENADLVTLFTSDIVDQHTNFTELLAEALPGLAEATDPTRLRLDVAPRLGSVVLLGHRGAPGFVDRERFARFGEAVDAGEIQERRRRVAIRDVSHMFYTSGTTAMPKGCPLTHEAIMRLAILTGRRFGYSDGDRLFDPLPLFHGAAIQPLLATLDSGGTYVTVTHFDPDEALKLIAAEDVNQMFLAFPTVTQALLNHPDYTPETFGSVKTVFNVGPADVLRDMQDRMPYCTQVSAYGMTEFLGSIAMVEPSDPVDVRCETEGRALPGMEIQIRDADGRVLGPGERGEIVGRGPQLFEGYYKDPEKTAASIEPDGWFHTGDLGSLDAEGRLRYLGRLKDMLKVGGENVAAIEIESFLCTHPAVSIAQVVGVPDPKYQEVPVAFVELRPGSTITEEELIEFCRGKIASFKVPRRVRFVTEWPMSATKIQKHRLRDQLLSDLSTG